MTLASLSRRHALLGGLGLGLGAMGAGAAGAFTLMNGVVIGKDGWLFLVFDDPRQAQLPRLRQVTGVMSDAIRLIRGAGIEVAVALCPAKARVYAEFLPEDFSFTPESMGRYGAGVQALQQSGAIVPDLAQVFANYRRTAPAENLYFKNDTHWTPTGAETAAVEVADQIMKKVQLPASRVRGTELQPRAQVSGAEIDLSKLLPAAESAKYPPESYLIRRPAPARGRNALVEDDTADVAAVGNSFVQPKLNFVPMLSSRLNRPVSLTWENHLTGPYKVLLNHLRSSGFRQQRPKVLVWNMHEIDLTLLPSDKRAFPQSAMSVDELLSGVRQALA